MQDYDFHSDGIIETLEKLLGDFRSEKSDLDAAEKYAKELAKMCHERAITWDQRSSLRAGELTALTEAIRIVMGAVSEKTTARTIRLAQERADVGERDQVDVRLASAVAGDEGSMEAIEAAV